MAAENAELAAMDRMELARFVKGSSTGMLRQIMQGAERAALLRRIFADMPSVFRPDRAGATEAVIHWQIGDRPDGGTDTFELVVSGGSCALSAVPAQAPRLELSLGGVDFLRMTTGNASPMALFLRGRMKAAGDLGLATRVANMFDRPKV